MTIELIPTSEQNTVETASLSAAGVPTNTVLIVTDNVSRAQEIHKQLERLNFLVEDCVFDGQSMTGAPKAAPQIVLVALTDYVEKASTIAENLKQHYGRPNLPVIGTLSRKADIDLSVFESVIYPPAHVSQIATRVESFMRLTLMEHEIMRRIETLKQDFGIDYGLTENALSKPFKVLFVGKPTPEFMVVINSLQEKTIDVVAAFTTFSAFDYLYETQFDAVVMNALEDVEPPITIASTMRRNAKLYHVPTLLLIDGETFDQEERAFEKGARDLIDANADLEEISGRILELANYHRIHSQLKREFGDLGGDACIDEASGTFNGSFFYSHLRRVCTDLKAASVPTALLAVKVRPNAPHPVSAEEFSAACAQVGSMLKNLVRMQDITARIDNDTFLIAFPYETKNSIEPAIERMSAIVDCAAFKSANAEQGPFTVELSLSAVELERDEDSNLMVSRALDGVGKDTAAKLKAS